MEHAHHSVRYLSNSHHRPPAKPRIRPRNLGRSFSGADLGWIALGHDSPFGSPREWAGHGSP
jgi:hypothetical protein